MARKNKTGDQFPPKRILDHQIRVRKFDIWANVAEYACRILTILSFAIPLLVVYYITDSIAGKETDFKVEIGIGLALSVGFTGIGAWVAIVKGRSQRKEIQRLRREKQELEEMLGLTTSSGDHK